MEPFGCESDFTLTMPQSFRFIVGSGCQSILLLWHQQCGRGKKSWQKNTWLPISLWLFVFCGTNGEICYLGKRKSYISWMVTTVVGLSSDIKDSVFRMFIGERPRFSQFRFCCLCLECLQLHSDLWLCVLLCVSFQRFFSCCGVVLFISVILSFRLDRHSCTAVWSATNLAPIHVVIRLCIWRVFSSPCSSSTLSTYLRRGRW